MAQTVIRISCTDQTLKTIEAPVVSSGGIGENKVIFDFCPLWEGFSKIAVFSLNEDTPYQAVIGTDNSCVIPAEPLMSQGNLYIGVYGVNADGVKRTTSLLKYKIAQGALEGVKPTEPTPDIYEQILSKIADVAYPEVPVQSVNGKSGKVMLTPEDIGAQPAGNYIIGESDPTVPAWAKEATKPKYTAGEVGAEERGAMNTHNTSPDAHNDLRLLIEGLTARFNAVFDSTDIDLDQMSEIVAYIKDNASLIESVTTSKVNVSDIVDNLTTNVKEKPLSAAQGVVLKDLIDKLQSAVNDKVGARHEHSAAEITSGILPVSRGGTGMSTGQNPNAVINLNGEGDCFNAIPTKSGALYATTDNGVPSFGTLPLAQGGTGATTAEMARASLGAAAATHSHSITELGDLSLATSTADGLMSKEDKIKFDDLDTNLETVSDLAREASSDVKEFREEFLPHISKTDNPHKVTAEQVKAIPVSGSNARPTYNGKDLAFESDVRTYSLTKDGSTIKLIGSDGEETSVTDTEGATIFVVIRGQTSFAECVNAYNAGKLLYCDIYNNGCVFPCVWADVETHFVFAGVFPDGKTMLSVQLLEDQGWQDMVSTEIPADVSLATGTLNGTIEITKNGTKTDVAVKGLGTAAYFDMGAFDASGAASTALSNAKSYTDTKIAALVNGAPDALNTLDEIAAALKDNAGIVDTLNEAIGKKANASDLTNLQAQVNKKANDYSIEIYNGTGGNPKPVKFLTVNYSTCGSETGVAVKIGMVSGHGNGVSYTFLQDAIIKVNHTGNVEADIFKYYGADTTYDGAKQYGDIFWVHDATNKIVDFYCLMGQYAWLYATPYKRVTNSSGGTITQHTSCVVYSSGTREWANKKILGSSGGDISSHTSNTSNPHSVTAAQTGALPLAGGLMNGSIKFQSSSLPQKTLQYICGIDAFAEGGEMGWQSKGDFLSGYMTTASAGTDGILPARLRSCQDHNNVISDPNSATATGFYYVSGATNRPPFSQSTNTDYRVLTTAYSDQWLQQIATDFRCTDVFVRRCQQGSWTSWLKLAYSSEIEDVANTALSAKSDVKDMRESLASYETTSAASNKLLEAKAYTDGSAGTALTHARTYTDKKISALINSAPSTLDTLGEIATAMQNNANVVTALEQSIGNKANASDFVAHVQSKTNPHNVTASQVGALSTEGGTLTGTLVAPVYKSDTSPAAIKPSDSNEINFGSNANYIYFGYENRVGSAGAVDTYYFGKHNGAGGAKGGKIECGEVVEGGTTLSSKYAPISLSTTVETLADSVREAQSDIKDMREDFLPLVGGKAVQGSPSTDSTISSMNRFQSDLFVQGDGAAPNTPQVAGFYLGKSATDENRHMDIVSGDTYSYIDFNKAGNNLDFDVRLLVNVNTGETLFTWDGSKSSKVFNVAGTIMQNGQPVALKSDIAAATSPTFYATYGSTAYADILAAYNAGKVVFCRYTDGKILPLVAIYEGMKQCDFNVVIGSVSYYVTMEGNGGNWAYSTRSV